MAYDAVSAGVRAAGVEYFTHELMPDRPMFRCVRMSASLQVGKCAEMWQAANAQKPSGCERCQKCPVGAVHAGEAEASMSAIRASGMCVRAGCNRTDQRLIGGLICVSCYNRSREVISGKNAKGKAPQKHPPLERRCVRYVVDGQVRRLSRPHTVATEELVIELLRDSPKRVMFGRGVGQSMLRQGWLV